MNDNPGNQPWGPENQNPWQPDNGSGQQDWGSPNQQSWGSPNQQPQNWGSADQQWSPQGPQPAQPGPYDGATQTWSASDPNTQQGQWGPGPQQGQGPEDWNAGQQPPWNPQQPPQGGSGGSHKGLGIGIAIVAVILVAAVGLTFFLVNRNKGDKPTAGGSGSASADPNKVIDDPAEALKDYFDALVKGDSKRALAYGSDSPDGSSKYLTDEMMQATQKAHPITKVQVTGGNKASSYTSVSASYSISDESVVTSYRLSRDSKGSHWTMDQAAADVDLSSLGSGTIKVNGMDVVAGKIALFPGGYTFGSGNKYISYGKSDDSTMYVKDPSAYVSGYDMEPTLTTEGVNTWRSLVKQSLNTCLASHKLKPAGCPFYSPTKTTDGGTVVENSATYSTSSGSSIDSADPRLADGTTKASDFVYLTVKVNAKAKYSNGSSGTASGSATSGSSKPTVDFGVAKPSVTWASS